MREVFVFCPELTPRFLPFVCMDPGRDVDGQLRALHKLEQEYPIYGIKISPVICQSKVTHLLDKGRGLLEFARERDLPLLFHTTVDPQEGYSHATDVFRVIEEVPDLRVCLAHCIACHRQFLERADALPNVWVDTSALKIQVQCVYEESPVMASPEARFPSDYSDHTRVMCSLAEAFPDTMIWGTDAPAYSYICRRQQAEGVIAEFRLKATYDDERAALDALPPELRRKVSNSNTLRWLFG